MTTPTQGTVNNPSAKTSYGETVYIISIGLLSIFTVRRYAKCGTCRRRVSVRPSVCLCVCVCHTPVLYENG